MRSFCIAATALAFSTFGGAQTFATGRLAKNLTAPSTTGFAGMSDGRGVPTVPLAQTNGGPTLASLPATPEPDSGSNGIALIGGFAFAAVVAGGAWAARSRRLAAAEY